MTKFYKQNLKRQNREENFTNRTREAKKKSKVTKPQQQHYMMIRRQAKQRKVCSCDLTLFVETLTKEGQFFVIKKIVTNKRQER